jgi:mRNA-degrading endonuclease RelE of RelBE toxin-antitoxin system
MPGLYRLRVGDWRVIFRQRQEELVVEIVTVPSRGSAYKP